MRLFGRARKALRSTPTYANASVVERIQADAGVDRETARAWFDEMLVFLDMTAASKEFIAPPAPVDVAWHVFILHTRDYEAYCRERFGRVIHHEPTAAPDPDAYRRAYKRRAATGTVDHTIWAVPAGLAAGGDGTAGDAGASSGDAGGGASSCGGGGGGCGGGGGG
jgi:hypothetical protein